MKIGDEVFVHGYVDEIRKDVIIIRNDGGYFGTVPTEIVESDGEEYKRGRLDALSELKAYIREMGTYGTADTPQPDCYMCKWMGDRDVCGRCRNRNLFAEADTEPKPKDEPQTERSE